MRNVSHLLFIVAIDVVPLLFVMRLVLVWRWVALVFILENIVCHCQLLRFGPLAVLSLLAPVFGRVVLLRARNYRLCLGS